MVNVTLSLPMSSFDACSDESLTEKMRHLLVSEITNEENVNLVDLIPFYLPKIFPQFERFVYLNSDAVVQVYEEI